MEITIVGAGAIGGVLGAYLVRAGHDVTFCDIAEDHVEAMNEKGLTIEGPDETFTVAAKAYTPAQLVAQRLGQPATNATLTAANAAQTATEAAAASDVLASTITGNATTVPAQSPANPLKTVLLAVKSQHTEAAVRQLLPIVGDETQIVSCQNGLCENIIMGIVGREKTIGCFVNFSADYLEPGRILYGGLSALYIGELDNSISPRIRELANVLSCWGPIQMTDNIWGYLWGKLSYAALLFATAMADATMAEVVRSMPHREALLELTSEVLEVAAVQGITPMGFDDWEPSMVHPREERDNEALATQLERLAARMAANKKTKSGVWRDLAVRKRKTEVDFQLVPVYEIGEQFGYPMPLLRYVVSVIHNLEDGAPMSWENLDGLNECYRRYQHA